MDDSATNLLVVNRLISSCMQISDNVPFISIGENNEREWGHNCIRISENVMLTKMSAKKGIKLFKKIVVKAIVKDYKRLDDMNVVVLENPDVITPEKSKNHLELWTSSRINDAVKLKGKHVLIVVIRGGTYPG